MHFTNMSENTRKIFFTALCEAQGDPELGGICSTNIDPAADWFALVEKNRPVLSKYKLSVNTRVERCANGSIKITVELFHDEIGRCSISETTIRENRHNKPLAVDSPDAFLCLRLLYEMLLGIASSNDEIEAELYGPQKLKHNSKFIDTNSMASQLIAARRNALSSLLGINL